MENLYNVYENLKKISEFKKFEAISIKATKREFVPLTSSKFGGTPYLPNGSKIPIAKNGEKMSLVAQINFKGIPKLDGFPEDGILQFFIASDEYLGQNFEEPTKQDNWRLVYYKEYSEEQVVSQTTAYEIQHEDFPIKGQYSLTFEKVLQMPNFYCVEFQKNYEPLFKKATNNDENDLIDLIDIYDEIENTNIENPLHQIGGVPSSVQGNDVRLEGDYGEYILLLQIDSENSTDSDNDIMWGDMGIANIFIHKDDLTKKDFSRCIYYWDCF